MNTQRSGNQLIFQGFGARSVVADFDGGTITSDAGALLLAATDRFGEYLRRFADCFIDHRSQSLVHHSVEQLVSQRVLGIALGYEDLNDWEQLRYDELFQLICRRVNLGSMRCLDAGEPLAGKSTLNRLELTPMEADARSRYKKIAYDHEAIERYFVEVFISNRHRLLPPALW